MKQALRSVSKWLTPAGLLGNLLGAILVAWSSSAFIGLVKEWVLAADPVKSPSLPVLRGQEGMWFTARHSDALSSVGLLLLQL